MEQPLRPYDRRIERREWWLWLFAITIPLLLLVALGSFVLLFRFDADNTFQFNLNQAFRALLALVLLFYVYVIYQRLQIHRIRRELFEQQQLFRLITENAMDMIAVVDADGRRIYNSPAFQKVLGYSQEELQNTSSWEQVHPDDRQDLMQVAEDTRRDGVGRTLQYRMRHKEGDWRVLESAASVIADRAGRIEKIVIVNRDVTERRALEQQLRQAQKMEAIGRLAGGIAHDFNNMLGVIIGYCEVLEERVDKKDSARQSVEEVKKAALRAAGLTRQLLAFSRQQVLEPKVLDLNAVVADLKNMLRRVIGEDIELDAALDSGLAHVKADQGQVEQVIMNLAVNARDAMPNGGTLLLKTVNVEVDDEFARQHPPTRPGSYVMLEVSDTGIGMDAETQAHIFEPFFTTKERGKGTGLGLATVYGVVKQSGGYIWVSSELGKGTTFQIYLPVCTETVAAPPVAQPRQRGRDISETILVVEDAEPLRKLTRQLLETDGYTVLDAASAAEAVQTVESLRKPVDLLLVDVVMPGGNGDVLAANLARRFPEMKVIFMSGYTGQSLAKSGTLEPGIVLIQKPFTRGVLLSKVREVLKSASTACSG